MPCDAVLSFSNHVEGALSVLQWRSFLAGSHGLHPLNLRVFCCVLLCFQCLEDSKTAHQTAHQTAHHSRLQGTQSPEELEDVELYKGILQPVGDESETSRRRVGDLSQAVRYWRLREASDW